MSRQTAMKFERPSRERAKARGRGAGHVPGDDMRLNISIPTELHWRIRQRATEKRQTLRAYIISLVAKDGVKLE